MNLLRQLGNCCQPACNTTTVVNVPGPEGPQGEPCDPCSDGQAAYTEVTDLTAPVQPAAGGTVTIEVGSTQWMIDAPAGPEGMRLCIGEPFAGTFMGWYRVVSLAGNDVEIENLGYAGAAAPGTPFVPGMRVTPVGLKGQDAAALGVYDTVNLTPGVSSQAIVAPAGTFGFIPTVLIATLHKPAGGMTFYCAVHSIAIGGFTADFSALIPGVGYSIEYLALP